MRQQRLSAAGRDIRIGQGSYCRGEAGTGLLSSALGLVFLIGFLGLATQVLVGLHQTSVVQAVASDAAHAAAEPAPGAALRPRVCDGSSVERAAQRVRELLGPTARSETACSGDGTIEVTVVVPRPRLGGLIGPATISRHAAVRLESAGSA